MSIKTTVRQQYAEVMDRTNKLPRLAHNPPEGWLATLRKALGMSGSEVAARLGVTRSAIYQAERGERSGAITIKQLQTLANAMGGELVYAIVPKGDVDKLILEQARLKAEERVRLASAHMALEKQSLPNALIKKRIEALTQELAREMPPGFWKNK